MTNTRNTAPSKYLLVSKNTANALAMHALLLLQKHLHLVNLINEETHLKRNHKSTAEIRDRIENSCEDAETELKAFIAALSPMAKCYRGVLPVPMLKSFSYSPDTCKGCPEYEDCKAAMKDYWEYFWAAYWNDSSKGPQNSIRVLPKNTFLISEKAFQAMDEDFESVCWKAEDLVNILKGLLSGEMVPEDRLKAMINGAELFLDSTFEHWIEREYDIAE